MPPLPSFRVAPIDASLRDAVEPLRVHPSQEDFVSSAAVSLARADLSPASQPMAILYEGVPIGFYRIERNAAVIADRDFGAETLGLRSFFIDAHWQGRGLARQALPVLRADLVRRYPEARQLVLTVNCRNPAALALYRGDGFEDYGELYHGGRAGPQYILLRKILDRPLL